MNPLLNPFMGIPLLKSYLLDPNRLRRYNPEELKRYQGKALKKIVRYAYTIPLYHEKYREAGVKPSDIKNIDDIHKLPFITKEDLRSSFPDKLLPFGYKKKDKYEVCTGGTTGKPVCIYTDFYTIGKSSTIILREVKELKLNWRNLRFVHIGNFTPRRIDLVVREHFQPYIKPIVSLENHLNIDVSTPIKEIMKRLNEFKPDLIMSYPAVFQHLAFLKRKGYGDNVNPKICWTGGAMLDEYTRRYVEDAFKCRMLNIYPSVEAGTDIAFECLQGIWHVHEDFFYIEAVDDDMEPVASGERGHIVLTRLWGRGTPIIRYTGMDDWVTLLTDVDCSCGLKTMVIKGGVEGRLRANIVLPNGKVFPPGAFCFITPILIELGTFKVKQYQVVQKNLHEIEILLVIDEDLRDVGPSVETIKEKIREAYEKKVGSDVTVNVIEVEEIKNPGNSLKPPPIVVSYVSRDEGYKVLSE